MAFLLAIRAGAEDVAREGAIQFSNGEALDGRISMTRGKELVLQAGAVLRTVSLTRLREIRLRPETEEMARKWRFLEAGQTKKEEQGLPYPVRNLAAELVLADGETIGGHLYTTVLYVETTNGTEKVILPAKQRGEEGTTLAALVYPARVAFRDEADTASAQVRVTLAFPPEQGSTDGLELCALTWDSLTRLEARKTNDAAQYLMPSPLGARIFASVRQGGTIQVGWPAAQDEPLFGKVKEAVALVRDFFEERELLGVLRDQPAGNVYSLMLLSRKGQTTLDAARNRPWRCEVWRWRVDETDGRLLLAGRGCFFRGIVGRDEAPPRVRISDWLCRSRMDGDRLMIGE